MSLIERRMDRRSFNKLLIAPIALPILSAVACREDPEPDPKREALIKEREKLQAAATARAGGSPAPSTPPGREILDKGSQGLAEALRRFFGMDQAPTDDKSQLKAVERDKRPTIQAPPTPRTVKSEAPKPAEKQEIKITLSPQDLYKALLTTPIAPEDLPSMFALSGNQAGNLDANAKAFNAIGQANIRIIDKVISARFLVFANDPTATISYTIFTKGEDAKGAYDLFNTQVQGSKPLQDFGYIASVRTIGSSSVCTVLLKNVFLAGVVATISNENREPEAILLAKTGIKHLQKVGNPGR